MIRTISTMAFVLAGLSGCTTTTVACDCVPDAGGLVLQAPAGEVQSIATGGEACADAQVRCVPMDFSASVPAGCHEYQVLPRRSGVCTITVTLGPRTALQKTVTMVETTGCCGGISTTDPAESVWVVGAMDSGVPDDAPATGG